MKTYDEIHHALRCCWMQGMCAECPYNDSDDDIAECTSELAKETMILLESQKRDNDRLLKSLNLAQWDNIDSRPAVNRWIPVAEKLPDVNEKVLFITKTYTITCGWYTESHGISYNKGFETESGFMWLGTVPYWMPLPEPPKEDIK